MKVLRDTEEDGYLDQAVIDGWLRIQVVKVTQYPPLDEQFFRRQFDFRFALAYVRDIGPLNVARKVRSRLAEQIRNERCVVIGLGKVIESKDPSVIPGSLVPFIAPDSGPPSERYVVRRELVGDPWRGEMPDKLSAMWQVVRADATENDPDISRIAGWNGHSGIPWLLSKDEVEVVVNRALKASGRSTTSAYSRSPVTERTETRRESGLTIFGYGNYVKTVVIPQLGGRIPVRCVHEIDPWQIGRNRNELWSWDTYPGMRPDEHPDVVVIASFHHTHSSIAVEAMERGARAVIIEKPIVTTSADLKLLCAAVEKYRTPVFAAFQRRYSQFNEYILDDLGIRPGEPVSCFGIAYEVPLPPQHWYRWPNSGSRIISNGCHWIDHFSYLNDFSPLRQVTAVPMGEASMLIHMILENEAVLSLCLTHEGSPRLGVREHCEFRANGVTATVTDAKKYVSESARGVIRKARVHRFYAYRRMYRSMSDAIAAGADGDSLQSLVQSSNSVLAAEAAMRDGANRLAGSFVSGFDDSSSSAKLVAAIVSVKATAADRPDARGLNAQLDQLVLSQTCRAVDLGRYAIAVFLSCFGCRWSRQPVTWPQARSCAGPGAGRGKAHHTANLTAATPEASGPGSRRCCTRSTRNTMPHDLILAARLSGTESVRLLIVR